MQGIKIEFTDETQPIYWSNFQKFINTAAKGDYSIKISLTYSELRKHSGMLNPFYAYRSGVETLHFMTEDNFNQFVKKWSNYEHSI